MAKKKSKAHNEPTAPRATPRKPADKLMMRFYEPLVLQHVLDNTRGSHIPCQPPDVQDESELDNCKLRRSFLNQLAYICDFKKGGDTVTAIALEETPAGVVFWVAANRGVKDKVVSFLEGILKSLANLGGAAAVKSTAEAEDSIFRCVVEFGQPRVKAYWGLMQKKMDRCLTVLGKSESQSDKGKSINLGRHLDTPLTPCDTTKICWNG